jgi:hypothetical protein
MAVVCNSHVLVMDDLNDYPSLTPLFATAGLTASELDQFLTYMETAITTVNAPGIVIEDCVSIHGDAILVYADLVGGENV